MVWHKRSLVILVPFTVKQLARTKEGFGRDQALKNGVKEISHVPWRGLMLPSGAVGS